MAQPAYRQLGDYRIDRPIGAGGMGQVFLAEHVHLHKLYAVKVLPDELAANHQFVARFHDEARVMADLRHPHIVQVHTMGCDQGRYFLAMDFVLGPSGNPESLHDRLKTLPGGRVPPEQVRAWAIQIAEALAYAHERGVVHRDIKPGNILIDADGNVKLTDFGLAKAVGQEFIQSQIHSTMRQRLGGKTLGGDKTLGGPPIDNTLEGQRTVSGQPPGGRGSSGENILGTYDYMAPEQRGEGGTIDQRTDIYAFGVLLYRMLTGKRPAGMAKPPSQVAGVDAAWDGITSRCLADAPADRYPAANDLLRDLRGVAGGRSRVAMWAGLAAAVVVVAIVLVKMLGGSESRTPVAKPRPGPTKQPSAVAAPAAGLVTLADVVPAKISAGSAWDHVKGLDRGQGFGKLLDDAETALRQASEFYGQKAFLEAKTRYEDLSRRCAVIAQRQSQRQAAAGVRATMATAESKAKALGADADGGPFWTQAAASRASAEKAFQDGDFTRAQEEWEQAQRQCLAAQTRAEGVARVRAARKDYQSALAAQDAAKLPRNGDEWKKVTDAVSAAEAAGDDFANAVAKYAEAKGLLAEAVKAAEEAQRAEAARQLQAKVDGRVATARELEKEKKYADAMAAVREALFLKADDAAALALRAQIRPKLGPSKLGETWANSLGMKLVYIPEGEFLMGSPKEEAGRSSNETQHRVKITREYMLGVHEVTRGQFAVFVKDSGYKTEAEKVGWAYAFNGTKWDKVDGASWRKTGFDQNDSHPVVEVSWDDAVAFCRWLSKKEGKSYRLPTDAEWEYACRAGTQTAYPWGSNPDDGKGWANCADQTAKQKFPGWDPVFSWSDGYVFTAPVGSFKPNAWGLYDMIGNAWEWCHDAYKASAEGEVSDPKVDGDANAPRVMRGGSWYLDANHCRSACRYYDSPSLRNLNVGFRCALDFP